jgi:hypothetical protein
MENREARKAFDARIADALAAMVAAKLKDSEVSDDDLGLCIAQCVLSQAEATSEVANASTDRVVIVGVDRPKASLGGQEIIAIVRINAARVAERAKALLAECTP